MAHFNGWCFVGNFAADSNVFVLAATFYEKHRTYRFGMIKDQFKRSKLLRRNYMRKSQMFCLSSQMN